MYGIDILCVNDTPHVSYIDRAKYSVGMQAHNSWLNKASVRVHRILIDSVNQCAKRLGIYLLFKTMIQKMDENL